MIRALADAVDSAAFGGKAVQLGAAVRAGLPEPAGFAVSFDQVDATARGDTAAATGLKTACAAIIGCVDRPRAVRSSAVGEDSPTASFAGAHETVLGEAVMSGLVTLDRYRLDPAGRLLERQLGDKDMAIRRGGGGGTVQVPVAPELAGTPFLDKEGLPSSMRSWRHAIRSTTRPIMISSSPSAGVRYRCAYRSMR